MYALFLISVSGSSPRSMQALKTNDNGGDSGEYGVSFKLYN